MTHLKRLTQGLVFLVLVSCGGGDSGCPTCPPPPTSGTVTVSLTSGISTIGALQVLVPTPGGVVPDSFTVLPAGIRGFTKSVSGGIRVVMFGPFTNGQAFSFWVPNAAVASQFTPIKEAAADRTSYALYTASDFTLTVVVTGKGTTSASVGTPMPHIAESEDP